MFLKHCRSIKVSSKIVSLFLVLVFGFMAVSAALPWPILAELSYTITATSNPVTAPINGTSTICANLKVGTVNQSGQTINFTTTSGSLSAASAVTDAGGNACVTLTGPAAAGISIVQASHISGALRNTVVTWYWIPVFSNLSSPTINCGSSPTVISGNIISGIHIPPGNVSITLNGVTQVATINAETGNFSFSFNTAALTCGTYTITYNYAGFTVEVGEAPSSSILAFFTLAKPAYAIAGADSFSPASGTGTLTVPCQMPVLGNLSSLVIPVGTPSTTISGNIKTGVNIPPGNVSIVLNGVTQVATINSANGDFSFSFNTGALSCGTYTISYNYAGSTCYIPAAAAGTLTVRCPPPPPPPPPPSPPTTPSSPVILELFGNSNPSLVITNLNVQPPLAQVTQPVTIYANIANRGDNSGSYTATLKINGQIEETKSGRVGGRAAVPLQFTIYKDKPGTYNVDINGQQTSFVITDGGNRVNSSVGASSDIPPVAFLAAGLLIIAILAILIIRRSTSY